MWNCSSAAASCGRWSSSWPSVATFCCCAGNAGAMAAAICWPVDGIGWAVAGSSLGNSSDGQMMPTAQLVLQLVRDHPGQQREHRLVQGAGRVDAVVPAVRQHEHVLDPAGLHGRREPAVGAQRAVGVEVELVVGQPGDLSHIALPVVCDQTLDSTRIRSTSPAPWKNSCRPSDVALLMNSCLTSSGWPMNSSRTDRKAAIAPDTCGAAIDVPLSSM